MDNQRGSALIMVSTLAGLLFLTALVTAINSASDIGLSNEEKIKTRLEFAAESGLKRAQAKIQESYNNEALNFLEPYITFTGTSEDDTENTPSDKAYEDETFNSSDNSYMFKYSSSADNVEIYVKYLIKDDDDIDNDGNTEPNPGWVKRQNYTSYNMKIESIAYAKDYGWVGLMEKASARRTTLFTYQIFFENDLEINPGKPFDLTGLIHTNENLYLTSDGSTLNIHTDSMTSAGEMFRNRLDDPNKANGTVSISSRNQSGTMTTMNSGTAGNRDDANNDNWINIAKDKWKGTVRDKNLGAVRQEAPHLQSFEPGGYYQQEAALDIEVDPASSTPYKVTCNGNVNNYTKTQMINNFGSALTESESSGTAENQKFYDRREYTNKSVKVTQLDVSKMPLLCPNPQNGLVYMTRTDAVADDDENDSQTDPNRVVSGFMLKNGSTLPQATTFVTDLPVYVKGDFNKHTPITDTWKPCAVISDALTLLSNAWTNANSNSSALKTATATEYNLVMVTGNVKTIEGKYNGGLENFPRMLENWSGVNQTIKGGFIQLYRSKYATGAWGSGCYSPPNRNWSSEPRFSDLSSLPPEFANLFPSTNFGIIYSAWRQISKDETEMEETYDE